MAITTISTIKNNLSTGARPNLFNVSITPPGGLTTTLPTNANLLCKSGQVPSYTIGMIEVPFRGRRIKVPGDRTFAEWTTTFIVDQSFSIRKYFEEWANSIKSRDYTSPTLGASGLTYYGTINVSQLSSDNTVVRTYSLKDAFPTDVSQIDLSYDSTDAIEEFTVTFNYHYFTV